MLGMKRPELALTDPLFWGSACAAFGLLWPGGTVLADGSVSFGRATLATIGFTALFAREYKRRISLSKARPNPERDS